MGQLTVDLRQATPPTPGQADKQPLVLPVAMALVGEQGRVGEEQLLVMEAERASITLQGQPGDTPPALVLRRFSAPVHVRLEQPLEECLQLLASDDDPFCRWEWPSAWPPGAVGTGRTPAGSCRGGGSDSGSESADFLLRRW